MFTLTSLQPAVSGVCLCCVVLLGATVFGLCRSMTMNFPYPHSVWGLGMVLGRGFEGLWFMIYVGLGLGRVQAQPRLPMVGLT